MFESGKSYQTNKLIDAAPDDDDEDIEDAEKSKTTQDTERKSGDGESASTTQEQGRRFTLCQLSEFKCTIIKNVYILSYKLEKESFKYIPLTYNPTNTVISCYSRT